MKRWQYKEEDLRVLDMPRIVALLQGFDEQGWTFKYLIDHGNIWKLKLKRRNANYNQTGR